MTAEFETVFERLKEIVNKHGKGYSVYPNEKDKYGITGKVGPAALKMWGGKMKKPIMSLAWVEIQKAYVSYHLMGLYANPKLKESMSKELKARMQGKSCLNFKKEDEKLFEELDKLTGTSISQFKKMGFVE